MAIMRRGETAPVTRRPGVFDPFEIMRQMLSDEWAPMTRMTEAFTPSFDVKETKDAFIFKADLPGVKEENLDISLTGNRLTVSGRREEEKRDEGDRYFAFERSVGSFSRAFTLPEGVDSEHVRAELKEGVLTLHIPKTPEVKARRIALNKGAGEEKAKA